MRPRQTVRFDPHGERETKKKFDLRSHLDNCLLSLHVERKYYAGIVDESVLYFGTYELPDRSIKLGCDYFTEKMKRAGRNRLGITIIKTCAEGVLSWRERKIPNRGLPEELTQCLERIICEANDELKQYSDRGHESGPRRQPRIRS